MGQLHLQPGRPPAYSALPAAIPIARLGQASLLQRGVLACDGP
jgi:hypothetical protein